MAETTETIAYRNFTITVKSYPSRHGNVFRATNDYGEPRTTEEFFKTAEIAIEVERKHLDACIDQ